MEGPFSNDRMFCYESIPDQIVDCDSSYFREFKIGVHTQYSSIAIAQSFISKFTGEVTTSNLAHAEKVVRPTDWLRIGDTSYSRVMHSLATLH